MRAYLDGTLSTNQKIFIPEDLWFANEHCDDNTVVSEDCLSLSGLTCESSIKDKGFSCRWKGVLLTYLKDGEEVETEDFTIKEFIQILKNRRMKLVNASAYFDTDVNMRITSLSFVDNEGEVNFDVDNVEEIEFIA